MSIPDVAYISKRFNRLTRRNPVIVKQLIGLYEQKHPGVSIERDRAELECGWKRMLEFNDCIDSEGFFFGLSLILGFLGVMFAQWYGVKVNLLFSIAIVLCSIVIIYGPFFLFKKWAEKQIKAYCRLCEPLIDFYTLADDFLDGYLYEEFSSAKIEDIRRFLQSLCVKIIELEKSGGSSPRIASNDPFLRYYSMVDEFTNLDRLRGIFRKLIKDAAAIGVVTGDLSVHYKQAEEALRRGLH